MNKLSKRVLSLLLALLMVLGTCDQALAAGLDNGRYASDEVTEVATDAPKDNAGAGAGTDASEKSTSTEDDKTPSTTESAQNPPANDGNEQGSDNEEPKPSEGGDTTVVTEPGEGTDPTNGTEPGNVTDPTEGTDGEGEKEEKTEEAKDATYKKTSAGKYTIASASGTYASGKKAPKLVVASGSGSSVESWRIRGSFKSMKLTVRVKELPELAEGETLGFVGMYGTTPGSKVLKSVSAAGDSVTITLKGKVTGLALVKFAAPAADDAAEEPVVDAAAAEAPAEEVKLAAKAADAVTDVKAEEAKGEATTEEEAKVEPTVEEEEIEIVENEEAIDENEIEAAEADDGKEDVEETEEVTEPSRGVDGEEGETLTDVEGEGETGTWKVDFYNRDGEIIKTVLVIKGEAIGDDMPATIAREDYVAYWAVGMIDTHGTITVDKRIDKTYVPEEDTTVVPDYDKVTYKVTFYTDEDKTETVDEKTVDVDTSYCLNDIPNVPAVSGSSGKWVYSGGDFSNNVKITADTDVWAKYDKTVFTVKFMVGSDVYKTDTYYTGDALELPADPVVEGKDFIGWFINDTQYAGGEQVKSDLTLQAKFSDQFAVNFVILNDDGTVSERLSQYFRSEGEAIGTMPQNPFVAGKVFLNWTNKDTGEEITAATVVNGNITAVANFRTVDIYNITAEYFYLNDSGAEVKFNTDLMQVEANELPYEITAPATTKTDPNEVSGAPIYYPEQQTITVTESDFDAEKKCTVRFKYVAYTAEYDYVYLLKNLNGDGYSEIDRTEDVKGVLNSYVTPDVKTFDYAVLERAEGATITQASGQELKVYYTRKNFQLSYESNGGSYVAGGTYAYGSSVNLPTTNPTRDGYDFEGWYKDEALTQKVTGSVEIMGETTLYAKWTGKTVNYTIVYMLEKYNNSNNTTSFEYDNSRTASATVGETVYASSAPDLTGDNYRGYEKDTAFNATSSVEIAADGSSVLVVHYKLIRYTLVFNANNGTIAIGGNTYTGSNYRIENIVLGQAMGALWPSSSNEIYRTNRYFDGWEGGPSVYITKQYELVWNHVANANNQHVMTYTASWDTSSHNRNAYYWLQQPDGTWVIADEYTQIGLNTNNLGAKDIDGYDKHNGNATRPDNSYPNSGNTDVPVWIDEYTDTYTSYGHNSANPSSSERTITRTVDGQSVTYTFDHAESYWSWGTRYYAYVYTGTVPGHEGTEEVYCYNFYYDRKQYTITYYFGETKLKTTDPIYYEADISGTTYNYTPAKPASTSTIDYSDYTWGGWYAESALQNPYTFDTMPGHNVVVYAKWIAPTFTVQFLDEDGTSELFDSKTVNKYAKVTNPGNPTKAGYVFDGWYTTADGDTLFDWNTQITANTKVYAHWEVKTLSYTVKYVDEAGNDVATSKTVTNPNFRIGQEVTESAIAVAGYKPHDNSLKLELSGDEETDVITFVYVQKGETTSYTVNYVIADGETGAGTAVAAQKTETVPGDTASIVELAAAVNYEALYAAVPALDGVEFFPDEVEKTLVLSATESQNVLTFYYTSYKNAPVTVHYVDMNGAEIASTDVQKLKVGKTFTLSRTPIEGWELNKAVVGNGIDGAAAGTDYKITEQVIEQGGLEFTLVYQKKATITVKSASKQYDGTALTLPEALTDQVEVEGLKDGHTLASVEYTYANADSTDGKGRLNAGTATVTPKNAVITGESNPNYYTVRYISGTLEVTKINVTVRIEPDRWTGNPYTGEEYKTGFTNPGKGIADYVMISHDGYKTAYLNTIWDTVKGKCSQGGVGLGYYAISETDAGDYDYTVDFTTADLPQNDNYSVSLYVREGRLQILPAALTVTTGSDTKVYDGTPLTKDEVTLDGLVTADQSKVTATATGSQTEVGSSENTYEITWGGVNPNNYNITDELGTLTVTENNDEVKLIAASDEKTYDGTPLTNSTVTADGLPDGFTVVATASGSQTDAGESANVVNDGYVIKDSKGVDKTANFTKITKVDGTLKVNKAPVTVTTGSGTKEYDGTALTNSEATITGLVNNETATVTATGSQTEVGSTDNTYEISWGTAKADNYEVSENLGTLEVTKNTATITLTAASDEKPYDGTPLTNNNVTATGLPKDFTVEATASGSATNVGDEGKNVVNADYKILDADGNDKTANFTNVTTVDGKLTITPINVTVTITGNNNTTVYDGEAHTVTGYTATASSTLYDVTKDFTFNGTAEATRTEEGTTNMGLAADQFANTNDNFATVTFNVTDGYQTITPVDEVVVTITGHNDTTDYDGEAHTVTGYDVEISNPLYKEAYFTFSGTASASRTDVGTTEMGLKAEQFKNNNKNFAKVTFNVTDGYQTINPIDITVTITGHNNTTDYDGEEHKVTGYDVSISNPLYKESDFTFSGTAEAKRTDAGTTNMGLAADQFTNTNENFGTVTFNVTDGYQTINPINVTVTIVGANNTTDYDGEEHKVTGYTATANSTLYDVDNDFTFSGTAEAARTDAGTTEMGLKAEQFTNTNENFGTVTFNVTDGYQTINPIDVTVTIVGNNNTADYDGEEHTVTGYTATASSDLYDVDNDFTFSGTAEAKRTNVGKTDMGLAADQFTNTNENFKTVTFEVTDGYQKIDPIDITVTITGHNNTTDYDGEEHSVSGYDVEISNPLYKETDFTFSGTAEAKRTDAGKTEMGLKAEQFTNTNTNFGTVTFNVTDGYQKIDPIDVTVTITGHNNTATYNSAEHKVTGYDVVIGNPLYKEADFTFSGTASAVRTNIGTTYMNLAADQFTNKNANFKTVTFNVTDGYQTVEPKTVTITAGSADKPYDGKALTESGFEASALESGDEHVFKVVMTDDSTITNFGTQPNVIATVDGVAVTTGTETAVGNYLVTTADGTLEITKAKVTLKSGDAQKVYDAEALTNEDVKGKNDNGLIVEEGWIDGEGATYEFTGEQTLVGDSENEFTYTLKDNTKEANYEIETVFGTLTVTDGTIPPDIPVPDKLVVTKDDGEDDKVYHVGDTITWTIWVKNIYDEEKSLTVTDAMEGVELSEYPKTLQPGEDVTITATYVVKPSDIDNSEDSKPKQITNDVTVKIGDLEKTGHDTVETEPIEITIKAASDSKTYDGTPLTNDGYEITKGKLAEGHAEIVTVKGTITDVKPGEKSSSVPNVVTDVKIIVEGTDGEDENDVTGGYRITLEDGTLTINAVQYTIKYVFDWPGGNAPAGAPKEPKDQKVYRHSGFTVSKTGYADIPFAIAPSGNPISVLRFQGWNTKNVKDSVKDVTADAVIHGAWTVQIVFYTVTYTDGVAGEVVFTDQVTGNLRIGANTPAFNGTPTREGYTFTGWSPAVSATVTGNNVYTAQWAPVEVPPEVTPEPTPEPTPPVEEEIVDEEVPQAAPVAAWALINLLAALGTVATAVGMIITFFKKKDDEDDGTKANPDEESDENKGKKSKFFGLIPAVASVVIFILTENMHNPMALVDKWTIPMVLILAANGIVAYLTRNKKPEDKNTETAAG